jgi:hypothetical protein
MEQAVFHIHAHLSFFLDGQAVAIPQGIGIAPDSSCFYWLHMHDASGVIHIEAPANRTFTFGNFLDIWGSSSRSFEQDTPCVGSDGRSWLAGLGEWEAVYR